MIEPQEKKVGAPAEPLAIEVATQWQLMWWKFRRHKLAIASLIVLGIMYLMAIFAEFVSPYDIQHRFGSDLVTAPPQRVRFIHEGRLSMPFVYGYETTIDLEMFIRIHVPDPSQRFRIRLFVKGDEYKLWGLIPLQTHLFGVEEGGYFFLIGSDALGRDLFSRTVAASRISLTIGLVGVTAALVIGLVLGGISGFYGGVADNVIQRIIDFMRSIPTIPLWMGLSAALPADWSILQRYFAITLILSIVGWTNVARVVRGKLISLRSEDFVMAARVAGSTDAVIIARHLIPSFLSYVVVAVTLAIPNMILGETALSFLGLGIHAPAVSWGVLLQQAQNMRTVAIMPWLMFPALFVIVTVLAFSFVGDGLRDAADPYKQVGS